MNLYECYLKCFSFQSFFLGSIFPSVFYFRCYGNFCNCKLKLSTTTTIIFAHVQILVDVDFCLSHYLLTYTTRIYVTKPTEIQLKIVDCGCWLGQVDSVSNKLGVVDLILLIRSFSWFGSVHLVFFLLYSMVTQLSERKLPRKWKREGLMIPK